MKSFASSLSITHHEYFRPSLQASAAEEYNVESQAQASFYLCVIGQSIRFHPKNFVRLLSHGHGFTEILLQTLPKLPWQVEIVDAEYNAKRETVPGRPNLAVREHRLRQLILLEIYSPYHQWLYALLLCGSKV